MEPRVIDNCHYEGGFEGMQPSTKARLTFEEDGFVLKRPRAWKRTLIRVWAKWSAVTAFTLEQENDGTRVAITTGRLGTGTIVVPGTEPHELWAGLDASPSFTERFPPSARAAEGGAAEGGAAGDALSGDESAGDALSGDESAGDESAGEESGPS